MPTPTVYNHCPCPGCGLKIPSYMLGCRTHWFQLPYTLRRAITTHYRKGQEVRGDQTPEYMEALRQCIEFWVEKNKPNDKSETPTQRPLFGA